MSYDSREKKNIFAITNLSLSLKIIHVKKKNRKIYWNCFVFSSDLDFEFAELTSETSKS